MLKNFLGCENLCMKLSYFIYHLIVACSEKNAPLFTGAHGKCVPDKGSDMRISMSKNVTNMFWVVSNTYEHKESGSRCVR